MNSASASIFARALTKLMKFLSFHNEHANPRKNVRAMIIYGSVWIALALLIYFSEPLGLRWLEHNGSTSGGILGAIIQVMYISLGKFYSAAILGGVGLIFISRGFRSLS